MNPVTDYLLAAPAEGPYLVGFAVLAGIALLVAIGASVSARRAGFLAVRRRSRQLRSICLWLAIPGGLYVAARYAQVDFFDRRIWLYLIVIVFLVRLLLWVLRLRAVSVEKVDERERYRKQLYRRGKSRRPAKRRR